MDSGANACSRTARISPAVGRKPWTEGVCVELPDWSKRSRIIAFRAKMRESDLVSGPGPLPGPRDRESQCPALARIAGSDLRRFNDEPVLRAPSHHASGAPHSP